MKKTVLTSFTILCFLFTLLLMGNRTSVEAGPRVIYVPTDYRTIQEAINNAYTYSIDTIFVYKGTYYENVIVYKSVSIVGEDRNLTIVDGRGTGNVISVTANEVSIHGFTIRNSGSNYSDSGIYISSSRNNISYNIITNNTYGIHLYSSGNNMISGNNISSNNIGIYLRYSRDNTICGNTASNNINGIRLDYFSNNNTIYHNNFINNIDQVWSDSTNFWKYGNEGNYWSDYTEQDLNEDGIGDTAYFIDANNQDDSPLMGTFSDFNVTSQGKTHYVTTICNSRISNFGFEAGTETMNKIRFNVASENIAVGLCRVMIPTQLMNYSYIVLVEGEETIPTLLDISNKTHAYLYFTYVPTCRTITIISSKVLLLYTELLDKYVKLQIDFHNLNSTYHELLNNYGTLLGNYSQLLKSHNSLNTAYEELIRNYSQLLERYGTLNASYQQHLLTYSELQGNHTSLLVEHTQNIRNLTYVFITTTAMFMIAAVYLSTHAHRRDSRS